MKVVLKVGLRMIMKVLFFKMCGILKKDKAVMSAEKFLQLQEV